MLQLQVLVVGQIAGQLGVGRNQESATSALSATVDLQRSQPTIQFYPNDDTSNHLGKISILKL